MEKSFLSFSPKVLSRKKRSKQMTSCKLKLTKPKVLPLQEVGSSSNWKNLEKKDDLCCNTFKDESVIILDDSISPCEGDGVGKTVVSKQKSPISKSRALAFNSSSNSFYQKHDTILLNESSSSREVLKYHSVNSRKFTPNESYDKIKQWLDNLHDVHQQKMYDPLWSTPRQKVAESSSGNSSTSNNSSFKLRVSETDSDRSFRGIPSSTPLSLLNQSNNQLRLFQTSKEDSLKLRISETSSDNSVMLLPSKSHMLNKENNALKSICKKLSISGSSEDSRKSVCEVNVIGDKGSDCSTTQPSSASTSSSNSCSSLKSSDTQHETNNGIGNRVCDESVSVLSTDTMSSAKKILTELYTKKLDVTEVITPKVKEKKLSGNLKEVPSKVNGSIDELLDKLYGNGWCKDSVLTPVINRKKKLGVRDKENTPPVNGQVLSTKSKTSGKSTFVLPGSAGCSTRNVKFVTAKKNLGKNTEKTLSFLKSLSASPPSDVCNPQAVLFKKEFKKKKESLVSELFQLFNSQVFDNKLPSNLKIEWNVRMTRTAGFCYNSWIVQPHGRVRSSRIELSTKVLNTPDRVRDTLIHELCHAATWVIDGLKIGHGPQWKTWTRKAMQKFPELPKIKVCHSYSIETKFIYKCKSCGYSIGRHSKSLDLERKRCGYCYGEFELFLNGKTSKAKTGIPSTPQTPRAASGFALYVKEHYKTVKERNAGLKHADIMKILGSQFSSMKVNSHL